MATLCLVVSGFIFFSLYKRLKSPIGNFGFAVLILAFFFCVISAVFVGVALLQMIASTHPTPENIAHLTQLEQAQTQIVQKLTEAADITSTTEPTLEHVFNKIEGKILDKDPDAIMFESMIEVYLQNRQDIENLRTDMYETIPTARWLLYFGK